MMKILFYNWTPIHLQKTGGGVAVYMRNLLQYISEHKGECGIEPIFLSCGYYYEEKDFATPFIRREEDFCGVPNYTIVNSPVIAPAAYAVNLYKEIWNDGKLLNLISQFIEEQGIDVVHLHSLEGLSLNVLKIKEKFPKIKLVHSIHDYGIICSDIRLWNKKGENCYKKSGNLNCCLCQKYNSIALPTDYLYARLSTIKGRDVAKTEIRDERRFVRIIRRLSSALLFWYPYITNRYCKRNIKALNKYSDAELCVSNRTAEVVEKYGLDKSKIHVDYIGTKVAENCLYKCRTNPYSEDFTILYMGYAGKDKGFYAFLDALECIDANDNIVIKIASRISDKQHERINNLRAKFKDIIIYNGYTHDDFPQIMEGVNLGVVPPLWEDNFPQVSIEMVANGIPMLTSNNGGAHELNTNPIFTCEDIGKLAQRIVHLVNNRELLNDYWKTVMSLTTMEKHISSLIGIYNGIK